jgi:hypothetical protein
MGLEDEIQSDTYINISPKGSEMTRIKKSNFPLMKTIQSIYPAGILISEE